MGADEASGKSIRLQEARLELWAWVKAASTGGISASRKQKLYSSGLSTYWTRSPRVSNIISLALSELVLDFDHIYKMPDQQTLCSQTSQHSKKTITLSCCFIKWIGKHFLFLYIFLKYNSLPPNSRTCSPPPKSKCASSRLPSPLWACSLQCGDDGKVLGLSGGDVYTTMQMG